jgi:phosphate transport system protein
MSSVAVPMGLADEHSRIVALTLEACELCRTAAGAAVDCVAAEGNSTSAAVRECEERLDWLDREIDQRVTSMVTQVSALQARELLACMKIVIDLERVGDLLLGFGGRAHACRANLEMPDVHDLIRMGSVLEKMIAELKHGLTQREVECALRILRLDSEIDRLRNLLFARHVEGIEGGAIKPSVQVLFMAQALERSGDHVKNAAEEICYLITGQSMRHLMRSKDKPYEQLFVEWLRRQRPGGAGLSQ